MKKADTRRQEQKMHDRITELTSLAPMPKGTWVRTDYGTLKDSVATSFKGTNKAFDGEVFDVPKYEVHRDFERNNFVITVYPAGEYEYDWGGCDDGDDDFDVSDFYKITRNTGDELEYVIQALKENYSTIVFWYQVPGEKTSFYDIYFNAWDIGDRPANKGDGSCRGFDDYAYLQSRMIADGLQDCKYNFREIRKGIVYPCPFVWYDMSPEELKEFVEDKGVRELQSDDEYWKRAGTDTAIKLLVEGHTFDEIFAKTKVKGWQIHRVLNRAPLS